MKDPDLSSGMKGFIDRHEKWVEERISGGELWEKWRAIHLARLADLRHERGIHLVVTFGMIIVAFLVFAIWLREPTGPISALLVLTFTLVAAYLKHYWLLENSAQRWMRLAERMEREEYARKS